MDIVDGEALVLLDDVDHGCANLFGCVDTVEVRDGEALRPGGLLAVDVVDRGANVLLCCRTSSFLGYTEVTTGCSRKIVSTATTHPLLEGEQLIFAIILRVQSLLLSVFHPIAAAQCWREGEVAAF